MNRPPALLDHNGNVLRLLADSSHYGASRTAKEFATWNPLTQSADAELTGERETLLDRSRDLDRNDGIVSSGSQTHVDNIVGAQWRLSAKPDYVALGKSKEWADEWARVVEAKWRAFADSTDCDATRRNNFHGLTNLILRSGITSGEGLGLPLWLNDRRYRTAIQLIDPERLSNPVGVQNSSSMREGIELNRYGEPVAYHIARTHPGDWMNGGLVQPGHVRIPALTGWGRRRVIHVVDQKRIGQNRGKPWISAIMGSFKMLDHYQRYELKAAIVNSMIAAFIETEASAEDIAGLFNADYQKLTNERAQWNAQLAGGAVIPLFPGDRLNAFTPNRPSGTYGQFVENVLRSIAAGFNLPYELLMKDFSKTNYSSARAALLEAYRFFMGKRRWLSDYWATPVYTLWLEEAVNAGEIEAPDFYENVSAYTRCKWIGAGRGWVDPVKEAQAAQIRMDANLSTLEDECAEQGKDWEEVLEQRAREQALMKELNLTPADLANAMGVVAPSDVEENTRQQQDSEQ